jgi:amino acid permease
MSDEGKPLSLVQVFTSVIASFLGVQSTRKRERDFTRGRAKDFILVALVLTAVFVVIVWGVVQLVLSIAVP